MFYHIPFKLRVSGTTKNWVAIFSFTPKACRFGGVNHFRFGGEIVICSYKSSLWVVLRSLSFSLLAPVATFLLRRLVIFFRKPWSSSSKPANWAVTTVRNPSYPQFVAGNFFGEKSIHKLHKEIFHSHSGSMGLTYHFPINLCHSWIGKYTSHSHGNPG